MNRSTASAESAPYLSDQLRMESLIPMARTAPGHDVRFPVQDVRDVYCSDGEQVYSHTTQQLSGTV